MAFKSKSNLDLLLNALLDLEDILINTKRSYIIVYSINFKNKVFNPWKIIIIIEKSEGRDLYKYFSTKGTPKGEVIDYKTVKGLDTTQI